MRIDDEGAVYREKYRMEGFLGIRAPDYAWFAAAGAAIAAQQLSFWPTLGLATLTAPEGQAPGVAVVFAILLSAGCALAAAVLTGRIVSNRVDANRPFSYWRQLVVSEWLTANDPDPAEETATFRIPDPPADSSAVHYATVTIPPHHQESPCVHPECLAASARRGEGAAGA